MAYDRIQFYPSTADLGIYGIITDKDDGKVWNGTALATFSAAAIDTYDVALIYLDGDRYGFTVPATLTTGNTYVAAFYRRSAVGAAAAITDIKLPDEWEFTWNGAASAAPGPGEADWYYSSQVKVVDLIGQRNLNIVFDIDDDGTLNTASVQRAGDFSDSYIDLKLRRADLTTPNPLTDTVIAGALDSASAHLAAWYGFHQRGLQEASQNGFVAIAGIMEGYKAFADELIASVIEELAAGDGDDATAPAGSFSFISSTRASECVADENAA